MHDVKNICPACGGKLIGVLWPDWFVEDLTDGLPRRSGDQHPWWGECEDCGARVSEPRELIIDEED